MSLSSRLFDVGPRTPIASAALLLLRLGAGGLMATQHGWGKLSEFSAKSATFPDPLGVGSETSLALTCVGEFLAPVLIMLGLGTRLAAVPAAFAMAVAAFVVHAGDPIGRRELALVYLLMFLVIAMLGPGRFSVDRKLEG
mgnify:CR=1 FL=1